MEKSVIYMSKKRYQRHRLEIVSEMAEAVLDMHYEHGAPVDELVYIQPSLEKVLAKWWDSLNTYEDPRGWLMPAWFSLLYRKYWWIRMWLPNLSSKANWED